MGLRIEGYEEISEGEYTELPCKDTAAFMTDDSVEAYFFKKAQKFPIVFENGVKQFIINKESIKVRDKTNNKVFYFGYDDSFPLLVKAVEKAKEVAKKNEN